MNKLVGVVNGANRGLGRAILRDLVSRGTYSVLFASCRSQQKAKEAADSLYREAPASVTVKPLVMDYLEESTVQSASETVGRELKDSNAGLGLVFNVAGVLHGNIGGQQDISPERRFEDISVEGMMANFQVNAMGPMLVGKHFGKMLADCGAKGGRPVFASMSARVGSISDNKIGGWYSYRAAKSAQNQFTRTLSIELHRRSKKRAVVVGLHPGTVATDLSKPFQKNVKPEMLFDADKSAAMLVDVIEGLKPEHTGNVYDYAFEKIPA